MTPLDARYQFVLPMLLGEEREEVFRSIPGVSVRKKAIETSSKVRQPVNVVDAPYTAAFVVQQTLDAIGLAPVDALLDPVSEFGAVQTVSRESEAHAWLWQDDEPTTAEPIRLLPFQRDVIAARHATGGGHIWAPAGSGKTVMSHTWGLAVTAGAIVIVTKADARETHRRELLRCTSCTPFSWKPSSLVRKSDRWTGVYPYLTEALVDGFRPVVIVGWDMLPAILPVLLNDVRPSAVIFDEIHRGKGKNRLKWSVQQNGRLTSTDTGTVSSAAYKLGQAAEFRLGTTATSIRHRTWDLWGQLSIIEPKAWGITITRFAKRHCGAVPGEYGGLEMKGLTRESELNMRLSFVVSKVPYSTLAKQLPPKRRQVVRIAPEQQVKALPRTMEEATELRKIRAAAAKGSGKAKHRLNERRVEDAASRKRKSALRMASEYTGVSSEPTGLGKVLLITGRRRDCEEIGRQALKFDIPVWWAHGDDAGWNAAGEKVIDRDAAKELGVRRAIQDAYMGHKSACLIVGTIDAWGESLNLQDTDVMLVVQLPYTPGKLDQLEGRATRLGQSRPVLIVYLVAEDTIDERVASIMLDKLPAVQKIAGGGALDGPDSSLKGLDDREAVLASLATMFGPMGGEE